MHIAIPTGTGAAAAELERPRSAPQALLVLTHGSGGGVDTTDLLAVRTAAIRAGIAVARVTQPYRVAGRRAPASADKQDAGWLEIIAALRKRRGFAALPMIVGGRSNGARVACRTAVRSGASAVVCLAFPLHPPGRPDKSRLDELAGTGLPTLVVQGSRDAFGMPPEGDDRELAVVPGADHSLSRDPVAVAAAVVGFVTAQIAGAGARNLPRSS